MHCFFGVYIIIFALKGELLSLFPIILIGLVVDSLGISGVDHVSGYGSCRSLMLPWMLALWLMFPLTLLHSLRWLQDVYVGKSS